MDSQQILPLGMLCIAERTVTELVDIAIDEVPGVSKVVSKILEPFRRKRRKGIWIEEKEKGLVIHVNVIICNTTAILPTCITVQERIKECVESVIGLPVQSVCIRVEQLIKAYPS
jgi:uncharacterized alkaline shock family protein YloU